MTDINIGAITEALNDKSDRDLRNVDTTAKADAVIDYQEPTAANNYTWYRKYKSGWVEQGGRTGPVSSQQVTLPVVMLDTNYVALASCNVVGGDGFSAKAQATSTTVATISTKEYGSTKTAYINWYVVGQSAN